jgi:hypothetical protein
MEADCLVGPDLQAAHSLLQRFVRKQKPSSDNATTRAVIAEIQRAGKTTLAAIAQELGARGARTPAGRDRWAPAQVSRLLAD